MKSDGDKMEPHKNLDPNDVDSYRPSFDESIEEYFKKASKFAYRFYPDMIQQVSSVRFDSVSPGFFFQEYMWVVHAAGFSAKAVGGFVSKLSKAYGPWFMLGREDFDTAFKRVKKICNNPEKSRAIHRMAIIMCEKLNLDTFDYQTGAPGASWTWFKHEYLSTPEKLRKLPYIGRITYYHLARNTGILECVKPDLHLIRMAKHWKFDTCDDMCKKIRPDGVPLGVVDLILWLAASTFGTLEIRAPGER